MNGLVKVLVAFFVLYQCEEVLCKKYIKILTIDKENEHGVLLHHLKPISFIKETITPFGTFSFRHLIEKRDLHKRKRRDVDAILNIPEVEALEESKAVEDVLEKKIVPTDIILARVEFYKAKPIETIDLHTSITPVNSMEELKVEDIGTPILSETPLILDDKETLKDSVLETASLNIPEESDTLEKISEPIDDISNDNKPVDVELSGELNEKSESASEATDSIKENQKKEIYETNVPELVVKNEPVNEELEKVEPIEVTPESSIIENRDVEIGNIQSNNIIENIGAASPDKIAAIVADPPIEKSVEIAALPIPVYIPLYTEIRTPVPIPAPEAPVIVSEVVNIVPPVVEVTEKVAVVPPPPPVETVTTVIERETTPSLFTRGSRFMLNISSRILKKMLRLVAMARTRLHLGGPIDE